MSWMRTRQAGSRNRMSYAQDLQTQMIVAQRIDTTLHVGTHFDGSMHPTDNCASDMAHLPLDFLMDRPVGADPPHAAGPRRRVHAQARRDTGGVQSIHVEFRPGGT
jgi:kynurenine formamidase